MSSMTIYRDAANLFDRMLFRARTRQLWGKLTGNPCELRFLDTSLRPLEISQQQLTLSVDDIHGSTGRPDRFDCQFRPRDARMKERWSSIAVAAMRDPVALPRIEVIELEGEYFISDGHHRLSVARALNKFGVDAVVTVWERVEERELVSA